MEAGSSAEPHFAPAQEYRAEEYRGLMRQRLANVTRCIRWTYSIFWSFSLEQQVLVWGEGYLDGADSTELSLRRSQQLRNLYNAMDASIAGVRPSSADITTTTTTPSVSAQNLTPLEWFYVGSMAVIFASGDGLPGLALTGRGPVWHYVTTERDTRVLLRAHLAQRAHLQTIVCIPALDGVLEIGTTALVEQDSNLLQQMQSIFLEQPVQQPNMRAPSSTRTTGQARESRASGEIRTSTSAFKRWATATATAAAPPLPKHPQMMLKAAVRTVPHLFAAIREIHVEDFPKGVTTSSMQNFYGGGQTSRGVSGQSKHVMAERKRREELNKRFETLRKLVPFVTKEILQANEVQEALTTVTKRREFTQPNKESLLADAIEYVIELERQVRELESTAKKHSEKTIEQDVDVTIEKSMAVMKISSAWQDDQLVDILQKIEDLQLEVVDVNAEVSDNKLKATLKAKVRSSDRGNEENKTAEIRAALLNLIEGKLKGKAIVQ